MYDIIGDIHGHARPLCQLLEHLGYQRSGRSYRHAERQVIFVGDFVDRGPDIPRVLEIARDMVERGHARAVMGNHEMNALAYQTPDPHSPEQHLRPRTPKNTAQHRATLEQLTPADLRSYLAWFRTLPLWLDLTEAGGPRVVHACWDDLAIAELSARLDEHGGVTDDFLRRAYRGEKSLYRAMTTVLKGREASLPPGYGFLDKEGSRRTRFRTRWYLPADGHTYRSYSFQSAPIECDLPLAPEIVQAARPYPPDAPLVCVGHYWLVPQRPARLAENVACVDYSVAKDGFLCAYRWHGESTARDEHFATAGT